MRGGRERGRVDGGGEGEWREGGGVQLGERVVNHK